MKNFKKMLSYYKPYMGMFWADMFFAAMSAGIALSIPLIVRYVTNTLIYLPSEQIMEKVVVIAVILLVMIALDFYCRFFIGNYGHVMGAKIEYDMRAEIFDHMQKLSFSFYDDQKVGQLMSRITTDLFDITELLHHGPENIILSVLKIVGALVILLNINPILTLVAFAILPFMFTYAFLLNRKMRRAFKRNRAKIAEINAQIEDNLSGIRVVKSFANESVENEKFKVGNTGFLSAKYPPCLSSFISCLGFKTLPIILLVTQLYLYQSSRMGSHFKSISYLFSFTSVVNSLLPIFSFKHSTKVIKGCL